MLLEHREKAKFSEEKAFEVMHKQESMISKWKTEHAATVEHFEKTLKGLKAENRHLHEK